jgi:hypothetical protein
LALRQCPGGWWNTNGQSVARVRPLLQKAVHLRASRTARPHPIGDPQGRLRISTPSISCEHRLQINRISILDSWQSIVQPTACLSLRETGIQGDRSQFPTRLRRTTKDENFWLWSGLRVNSRPGFSGEESEENPRRRGGRAQGFLALCRNRRGSGQDVRYFFFAPPAAPGGSHRPAIITSRLRKLRTPRCAEAGTPSCLARSSWRRPPGVPSTCMPFSPARRQRTPLRHSRAEPPGG